MEDVLASFEVIYEEEDDALEVSFATFDEHFARAIVLNDHLTLHTDTELATVWGMTFYSYATLLQVNETFLEGLRELPEEARRRVLALLNLPPASYFLQVLKADELRAQIKAPTLLQLIDSP